MSKARALPLIALIAALVIGAPALAPILIASPASAADAFTPVHIPVTVDTFHGLTPQSVDVTAEDGTKEHFEGVALGDVLEAHGVALGHALRGPALAHYALVKASDGYRAVYALPELDRTFNDRVILLADKVNGAPLDARTGPFRIVVPGEKHEARWVRQVTEIDVEAAP
jgi:hypothetical protein